MAKDKYKGYFERKERTKRALEILKDMKEREEFYNKFVDLFEVRRNDSPSFERWVFEDTMEEY